MQLDLVPANLVLSEKNLKTKNSGDGVGAGNLGQTVMMTLKLVLTGLGNILMNSGGV